MLAVIASTASSQRHLWSELSMAMVRKGVDGCKWSDRALRRAEHLSPARSDTRWTYRIKGPDNALSPRTWNHQRSRSRSRRGKSSSSSIIKEAGVIEILDPISSSTRARNQLSGPWYGVHWTMSCSQCRVILGLFFREHPCSLDGLPSLSMQRTVSARPSPRPPSGAA